VPTVLITGSARRIGAGVARALAADGWRVLIHYHHSAEAAAELATGIQAQGGACDIVRADLLDRDEVAALIPDCTARFGRIDCLVNNASSFRFDSIRSMRWESWDEGMRANLESPLFLCRAFAEALGEAPGDIVNMLDHKIAALNPDFFSYTVAKIGLAGATRPHPGQRRGPRADPDQQQANRSPIRPRLARYPPRRELHAGRNSQRHTPHPRHTIPERRNPPARRRRPSGAARKGRVGRPGATVRAVGQHLLRPVRFYSRSRAQHGSGSGRPDTGIIEQYTLRMPNGCYMCCYRYAIEPVYQRIKLD
jgi:hypothetical protein